MVGSLLRRATLAGSLLVGASVGVGGMTALAQSDDCSAIQFEIANPSPGSRVNPGNYVLEGVAVDTRAEQGTGIDRIDFFLGSRDDGGVIVGHAMPTELGPFEGSSFATTVTLPNQIGAHELFGYAHSAISGQESVISMPIALGLEPSKAGDRVRQPEQTICHAGTPVVEEPQPSPGFGEFAMPAAQVEEPSADMGAPGEPGPSSQMFLDVGNPSSGDMIHVGKLQIEGIAFDRAAEQSPGIDRIDVFLDDRDAGGTLIGHGLMGAPNPAPDDPDLAGAGWTAQINLTPKMTGGHTLFFYALSAATGEEMVVGVPVLVVR